MNSKRIGLMATLLAGAAMSGDFYELLSSPSPTKRSPERVKYDKQRTQRANEFRNFQKGSLKAFEINGEKFYALNHKNALKKYNRKYGPKN